MSLKIECHSKWNATQNGKSHKITQNSMSLKMDCILKWNVTQNGL